MGTPYVLQSLFVLVLAHDPLMVLLLQVAWREPSAAQLRRPSTGCACCSRSTTAAHCSACARRAPLAVCRHAVSAVGFSCLASSTAPTAFPVSVS